MAYSIENGIWNSVFAVPCDIVDKHLKLCGEFPLKVLLLVLRQGNCPEPAELARILGKSEADIRDAIEYWVKLGVLQSGNAQAASATPVQKAPSLSYTQEPDELKIKKLSSSRPRLLTSEINEMARSDNNIVYLLQEAQTALGRDLTPVATDTVVSLYSYYGMSPDLILMLMHYCVSLGKTSLRYMEKVAANWIEKGIDTHEKAEHEIFRVSQRHKIENKVMSALGIRDRDLITSEKKYVHTWTEEWHFDIPLIMLAYERTIEQKGKLSFPYINGILSSWLKSGISTPEQAMREERPGKPDTPSAGASSYDMGELEDMITYGSIR